MCYENQQSDAVACQLNGFQTLSLSGKNLEAHQPLEGFFKPSMSAYKDVLPSMHEVGPVKYRSQNRLVKKMLNNFQPRIPHLRHTRQAMCCE